LYVQFGTQVIPVKRVLGSGYKSNIAAFRDDVSVETKDQSGKKIDKPVQNQQEYSYLTKYL